MCSGPPEMTGQVRALLTSEIIRERVRHGELAVVGARYEVFQNREIFGFLQDLVDRFHEAKKMMLQMARGGGMPGMPGMPGVGGPGPGKRGGARQAPAKGKGKLILKYGSLDQLDDARMFPTA